MHWHPKVVFQSKLFTFTMMYEIPSLQQHIHMAYVVKVYLIRKSLASTLMLRVIKTINI